MKKSDLKFWQKSGRVTLFTATHPEYGQVAGYIEGGIFHAHQTTGWGSFFEREVWAMPTIKIPLEGEEVLEVADRFLRRKATISELRAAVKAAKGIPHTDTWERDRQYLSQTGEIPAGYTPAEIDQMRKEIVERGE